SGKFLRTDTPPGAATLLTAERIEGKWHRYDETASARSVYNYYRVYDPDTGRYLQSDPIGLDGGQNHYVYAENSPLQLSDPNATRNTLTIR
ncbi:MAG: RHS repeat-associated core domain-containing protein, partial [Gammaproteobacteria bacterium]|nr:RHS repeat-associated core domain-containing protein [Gammaproteobacteria bacterium]